MRFLETLASSLWSMLAVMAVISGVAIGAAVLLLGMKAFGAVALYFVVWWIVLLAVLPVGIRSQNEAGITVSGTEPGAPFSPRMRERAIVTTLIADAVFLASVVLLPLAGL